MSLRAAFERTLIEVATTRELLSLAVLSVLFYAFYYPAPYSQQEARGMPVVVVDQGQSVIGRDVIRALGSARTIDIVGTAADMRSAEAMLLDRRVDGILLISRDLDRTIANPAAARSGAGVSLIVNAAYFVRAESIGLTLTDIVIGAARRREATIDRHLPDPDALIRVQPLFNTTAGYRDYIFPAISNIILQQTLLFASARLAAERRRRRATMTGIRGALGTWLAMLLIGMLGQAFFFGIAFWVQDVPRGGNVVGLLLAMPLFAGAVAALGLAIGHAVGDGDDVLKLVMPTSVPLVFLAGFAWPLDQMPPWLATLAWLSPATAAMHLFVRFNQMGATIAEAGGPLAVMAALFVIYTAVFLFVADRASEAQSNAFITGTNYEETNGA